VVVLPPESEGGVTVWVTVAVPAKLLAKIPALTRAA
jgi:hypothetical protein